MELSKLKLEYEKVKQLYKTKGFISNIKEKNIDDSYANTVKKIDDENKQYNTSQGVYSFLTGEIKKQKLLGETNKIINKFLTDIMPLTSNQYKLIEMEMLHNKIEEEAQLAIQKENEAILKNFGGSAVFAVRRPWKKIIISK